MGNVILLNGVLEAVKSMGRRKIILEGASICREVYIVDDRSANAWYSGIRNCANASAVAGRKYYSSCCLALNSAIQARPLRVFSARLRARATA